MLQPCLNATRGKLLLLQSLSKPLKPEAAELAPNVAFVGDIPSTLAEIYDKVTYNSR
jgi:hypothetical protein